MVPGNPPTTCKTGGSPAELAYRRSPVTSSPIHGPLKGLPLVGKFDFSDDKPRVVPEELVDFP